MQTVLQFTTQLIVYLCGFKPSLRKSLFGSSIAFCLLFASPTTNAQGRLAGWNFDNTFAPTASSTVTGITASAVTTPSGLTGIAGGGNLAGDDYFTNIDSRTTLDTRNWAIANNPNPNKYIEFTVTPSSNATALLTSINLDVRHERVQTGTFIVITIVGVRSLALRSSLDGFANDIATAYTAINTTFTNVTFTLSSPISTTAGITFRLYGYEADFGSNLNSLYMDNLQVNGTLLYKTPTALTGLDATCGAASAAQSFTIGGANLPNSVSLTAPAGFELAPDAGGCPTSGYASTTVVDPSSLTGSSGQVFCVRQQASVTPGVSFSTGNLTISTGTSLSATIALSGSPSAAHSPPTIAYSSLTTCSGSLSFSACSVGQTAVFSVTGGSGTTANNVLTLASAGAYTISAICVDDASSCSSTESSPVSATVNNAPDATFTGLISNYCIGAGPVTLTPNVSGGTFSLSGAGNLSGNVYTPPAAPGGAATISYSVTVNGCSASSSQGTVTGAFVPPITSLTASGSLGEGNCTVQLTGVATGTSFVFTGPEQYVFSNVYRTFGTYSVFSNEVKTPGTYTLTASTEGGCVSAITQITVNGTACN